MARIFISYSRIDTDAALSFVDALRNSGFEVWLDQRDIPVSVPWLEEIEAAIHGSALLVVVDSEHWRKSENCRAEAGIAEQWWVPQVRVDAEARPAEMIGAVANTLSQRTSDDDVRTELFVRAGDWAGRGRPAGSLVSGRTLRNYSCAARRLSRTAPAAVHEFIGACRRRQRRRTALRRIGLIAAIVLIIGGLVAYNAFGLVSSGIDTAIKSMDKSAQYDALHSKSPYALLEYLASADGGGWLDDYQFSRAFSESVPTDVVPADSPPGAQAVPTSQIGLLSAVSPDGTLRAELGEGSTVIIVETATGMLHRVLTASSRPTTLAWSPAGDRLGAAEGAAVELLDVAHGSRNELLRGSVGRIRGIAMTDTAIHALTDRDAVVTWPAPWHGTAVRGAGWIMDAEPVGNSGNALLLDRSGTLTIVDAANGTERGRLDSGVSAPGIATALAVDTDGKRAAVLGATGGEGTSPLHVIDLATRETTAYGTGRCDPVDVTFARTDTVILACGDAGVAVVDLESHKASIVAQDSFIASVAASGNRLAAGTRRGDILELGSALKVSGYGSTECAGTISALRFTRDGKYLFHGGTAAGNGGCAIRADFGGGSTQWNHLIVPDQEAHQSRAVAVSPNGALVALGFGDGVVRIYSTDLMQSVQWTRPFTGEIRGLVFSKDGDSLLIATRDGDIAVASVPPTVPTLREKQTHATELVDRAIELGLYKR